MCKLANVHSDSDFDLSYLSKTDFNIVSVRSWYLQLMCLGPTKAKKHNHKQGDRQCHIKFND